MKRIIELAVKHPRKVILFLLLATLFFIPGIRELKINPSTEALMPKNSHEYKINTRAKKIFGDSKLFLLTLIEGEKTPLFSEQSFQLINELVSELEEFKYFDFDEENKRLNSIIELGAVKYTDDKTESINSNEELISDEEIDALLTSDSTEIKNDYFDVFDTSAPVPGDIYTEPIRKERVYSFTDYKPVSLVNLEKVLNSAGKKQLKTILLRTGLSDVRDDHKFTAEEYKRIVDEFETAYLLKSIEIIKGFANPITGEDISGTKDALVPVKLVERDDNGNPELPVSADDFTAYRQKLLANPIFENSIYSSKDGKITSLAINIQFRPIEKHEHISRYVMDMINKYNDGNLLFTTIGIPVFERYIQEYLKRDMKIFLPFVFIVVILTFFFNFRSLSGVLLPTLSIIASIIWTMGLMGYLGIPITMVVNALPTILVAVGSSYSIHIINQYLHDKDEIEKQNKNTGLINSMTRISLTVFLAAFTTFIGFSTLGFNQVVSLKQFGIFSAIGTIFAMFISLLLNPAVLSFNKREADKERKSGKDTGSNNLLKRMILRTGNFTISNPWPVVIVTIIIFAASAYGVSKIKIESSPLYSFKDDSYLLQSDRKVSQALDGNIVLNLMIDTGKPGGVKDPEFLRKIDELGKLSISGEFRSEYQFLASYTFADIIKRMNKAMNAEKNDFYKVPDSRTAIEDYIMLYSGEDRDSDGRIDAMERFIDPQYRVANIFIKTGSYDGKFYSTDTLLKGIDALSEHINNDPYFRNLKYSFAGQSMNYAVLNNLIAKGQILTIILTLIIIAVIIFVLFKDIKAAFVSLIPISCSIAIVYGTMGFLGIPLDVTKAILAAVTIGIGIDDTIHMLKTIRNNLMEGYSLKESILKSYKEAGMAITYTSIALILGFSVFMFSEFKVLFYFGWLVAFNMIITTVAALVVLPAAVYLLKTGFHLSGNKNSEKQNSCMDVMEREISYDAE